MGSLTGRRVGARNPVSELRDSIPARVQDIVGRMVASAGGSYNGAEGTITLPGGAVSELSGTGTPNGIITASPGTYYTDIAGTNGAWRWLKKSGTGNTGWDVVRGDTGWRRVGAEADWLAALQPTGVTLLANQPRVRRINNIVYLSLGMDTSTSGSLTATGPIPTGWRHSIPMAVLLSTSTYGLVRAWFSASSSPVTIQGSGPMVGAWGLASYVTNDPWPATLPGTPA